MYEFTYTMGWDQNPDWRLFEGYINLKYTVPKFEGTPNFGPRFASYEDWIPGDKIECG